MEKRVLPLLLASAQFLSDDETEALDRLRMQKGVFLLEQRGPTEWQSGYDFSPYNWGPFSRELATDLTSMTESGELVEVHFEGFRYGEYRATESGEEIVNATLRDLEPEQVSFVNELRHYLTHTTFSSLLKGVYAAYPEYATRSKFSG